MRIQERRATYGSLWVLALAFGWIEASVVVYLREIYMREASLQGTNYFAGSQSFQVSLLSLPSHVIAVEMAREACTIVLLGAVAWLAGRRSADRAGAFLLSFGIWDLTYYAGLKLALGWPDTLRAWDILFLIPLPWVAPVWAPVTVSVVFVAAGSYLFWTSNRERRYQWPDVAVLAMSVSLTIAAFLVDSRAATDHRVPEGFPVWLFWAGIVLGTAWFVRVERRDVQSGTERPWVDVRVRTIVPEHSNATIKPSGAARVDRVVSSPQGALDRVIWEYAEANRRLDALVNEASGLGDRFERLAHGLSMHPRRMIIGLPDRFIEDPTERGPQRGSRAGDPEWDVVPGQPLPRIESVAILTDDIREAALQVEGLREQLILMGRADLVEHPDGFFH